MNLSTTVTERDKRLLLIVCAVGFSVLFIAFLLTPALTALGKAQADLTAAELHRAEMQQSIALADTSAQNAANAKSDLQTVTARFYPLMENGDIDSLITGLELEHKLTPLTLSIGDITAQSIVGYAASSRAGESAAATETGGTVSPATEGAVDSAANTELIFSLAVSCSSTGTREDFTRFLDDLAVNYPAIQLASYSISESSYLTREGGVASSAQLSCTLVIYLCDKEAIG